MAVGPIMEQIRVAIQTSRLCIADVTDGNPNVMYELGLAQSVGIPTVLLCQNPLQVPFDVRSDRLLVYDSDHPERSHPQLSAMLQTVLSGDKIAKAEGLLASHTYRAAILEAYILIDSVLRQMLLAVPSTYDWSARFRTFREVVKKLEESEKITKDEVRALAAVIQIRNSAVHESTEPTAADARKVVAAAEAFFRRSSKQWVRGLELGW